MRSLSLVLAAGLVVAAGSLFAEEEGAASIPTKRVVMFSSGVSFFERGGEVEGDATVDLKFNTRDINDLLKSMVLSDGGGGRISTVSYGSKDPITRTLATFSIDLTSNPTLGNLLDQIRGEKVEIDGPTKVNGIILGTETHDKDIGDGKTVKMEYLKLLASDGLRRISLDEVGVVKLANPKLDAELRQALEVLALGNSKDKKTVALQFNGEGKRPVRVGYVQESPIWKTSYRLVLSDEKPLLQGWAIVENTTEEDWNDVALTLISGRPISFAMDLYEPLYVNRPEVKPELYASLRPRTYEQDLAGAEQEFRKADETAKSSEVAQNGLRMRRSAGRGGAAADPFVPSAGGLPAGGDANENAEAFQGIRLESLQAQTVQSVAQASDVGEMFQYKIAEPVTLGRQKSALLPIVNDSVEGEKVSIYNASVHPKHPLNGLRLKNTTDLHLMQGPITVFDDGAYAGDAQVQALPPKSERLISYAMDLDTEVAPVQEGEPEQLVNVRLAKGTLFISRKFGRKFTWTVKNSGKKEKKVLIEQALDNQWKLIEPKEAGEKTRDMYRFVVNAAPGKPAELRVREERVVNEQLALTNLDDNAIIQYINAKVVSEKVKEALQEVVKRKQALAQIVAKRAELERQVAVIFEEQNRIRQNMEKLPKESDIVRRYTVKFDEQETTIEKLRKQIQDSVAEETAARQALDAFVLDLDLS